MLHRVHLNGALECRLLALIDFDLPPMILQSSDVLETVDVTGDGGILKLILQKGDGAIPKKGQVSNCSSNNSH